MPDAETATAKAQSDFDGALVDYKAKGFTVVLVDGGRGRQTGAPPKVTRADLPTQHVYLDPETFVEMRVTTEGRQPARPTCRTTRPLRASWCRTTSRFRRMARSWPSSASTKWSSTSSRRRAFELSNALARFAACRLQRLLACGQASLEDGHSREDALLAGCAWLPRASGAATRLRTWCSSESSSE